MSKWFGDEGKIPYPVQAIIICAAGFLGACLILPWVGKFLVWYWPWVRNV